MNKQSFTYEQYCNIVGKNIIIHEQNLDDGRKKVRCLHYHKYHCDKSGGCKNKYIKEKIR